MIVAFDIDGTITRHPPFFALVSCALVQAGHKVVIITFRDDPVITKHDLQSWGIAYDELVCWSMDGADGDLANIDEWKAKVCRQHGVDVFFEDDPDVLACIDASTLSFMPVCND